jgi:S-DNA-T family DNA segregation ATPase FtsK/SpoIIIE
MIASSRQGRSDARLHPARLAAEHRHLEAEVQVLARRLEGLVALGRAVQGAHQSAVARALEGNLEALRTGAARHRPPEQRPWDDPAWGAWTPAPPATTAAATTAATAATATTAPPAAAVGSGRQERPPTGIIVGEGREVRSGQRLGLPVEVDLVAGGRPVVIRSRAEQHRAANGLLQSVLVRCATLLPDGTSFALVDPVGGGRAFPLAPSLPTLGPTTGGQRADLEASMAEIDRRAAARGVAGVAEPGGAAPVVVAVADFPVGYERRVVGWVLSLCRSVPPAGMYLLIHHRVGEGDPLSLGDATVVDLANPPFRVGGRAGSAGLDVTVSFDDAPPVDVTRRILAQVRRADVEVVRWDELGHPAEEEWWGEDATHRVVAPIGRVTGGSGVVEVTFGVDGENRPCAHGAVVAMTGAGKTALFHALIAGLAVRYSPAELCLYLLDGKNGVGFAAYRGLPHAAVVSLRTRPGLARSVLDDLVEEMERRNEVFKRHGAEHFAAYRATGSPEGRLPRLVFMADEFQLLFEDDRDGRAARALLRLSEQGRSAGIHLLLGSQHFAPAAMTYRNLIFANLHLRIAMQMAVADVRSCMDFGPEGRRLIEATCTRTGRLVANGQAGDDSANRAATAGFLDERRRSDLLAALRRRGGPAATQVVLDGDSQPELADDPLIGRLGASGTWPDAAALHRLATGQRRQGGLGEVDWAAAEHPLALALGQELNVRGRAVVVLRRRRHEHLCVVGEAAAERVAMLATAVVTACLQRPPDDLRLRIADRCVPGSPWSSALRDVGRRAGEAGYDVDVVDDDEGAARVITEANEELARRRSQPDGRVDAEATWLVVVSDPDRVGALARLTDDYGYVDAPLGQRLGDLLESGGEVGIHVLMAFSTVGAARVVMADRRLRGGVRHRVALQMSDDDSFVMVGSPAAARLQTDGPRPVAAVHFDRQGDRRRLFKPYSLASGPGFEAQVEDIFDRLARRRPERLR